HAVQAVHRPGCALGTDAQAGEACPVAGSDPRRGHGDTATRGRSGNAMIGDRGLPKEEPQNDRRVPASLRPRVIFLIGYRGSGKTTVARILAERLGWSWLDADTLLEARHGRTIRQIFAEEGEAGFRDKEERLLDELSQGRQHVIATGGGIVLRPVNRDKLKAGCV